MHLWRPTEGLKNVETDCLIVSRCPIECYAPPTHNRLRIRSVARVQSAWLKTKGGEMLLYELPEEEGIRSRKRAKPRPKMATLQRDRELPAELSESKCARVRLGARDEP